MRICLLVVDDEAEIVRAIARGFAHKWTVTQCTVSDDAIEILNGPTPFDAILLDLYMMPGASGVEIFENISEDRRARVIFYTGGGARDSTVQWLNEQKRPVLRKPVSFDAIEHTVNRVVAEATAKKIPRGPADLHPVIVRDAKFEEFATRIEKRLDSAIKDAANTRTSAPPEPPSKHHKSLRSIADDADDPAAEITAHGKGFRIPEGSWLEREMNKAIVAREKQLALELAAGRWGKLVAWWQEWWKRLLLALVVAGAGVAAREIIAALAFAARHVH